MFSVVAVVENQNQKQQKFQRTNKLIDDKFKLENESSCDFD